MLLGLALIPTGLWLTFVMPGEAPLDAAPLVHAEEGDRLFLPIMLGVSVVGLALSGLGAGALFGTQGRMRGLFQRSSSVATQTAEEQATVSAELPFWVCGDCRVVEPGASITARCTQCGSVSSFVQVESDADRQMARSVLGHLE